MKKIISYFLCLASMILIMASLPLHSFAKEGEIDLPEFEYPIRVYSTFEEMNIPYDEILACFPENLEIKHENNTLFIKDLGADRAYIYSRLDSTSHEGTLEDGYWKCDFSDEQYNAGGSLSMNTDSHSWRVEYDISGRRGIVSLTKFVDKKARIVSLYPTKGYGEQYVQVIYDMSSNIRVTDSYSEGYFKGQSVRMDRENLSVYADYDSRGNVTRTYVSRYDTNEYAYFVPGKGWSKDSREYVPVKAPKGFENETLESLLALVPTEIGCDHKWSEALCDVPIICSVCKRQNGNSLGHNWISGDEHYTCSTCNGILYRIPNVDMPDFEECPSYSLDDKGINFEDIKSVFDRKITVKYENGVLMVPNFEGSFYSIRVKSKGLVDYRTENGWNLTELDEESRKKTEITFFKSVEHGDGYIEYELLYDYNGDPVKIGLYNTDTEKNITISFENDVVELSYKKNKDGKIEYVDIYENSSITSQTVVDDTEWTKVFYDSNLKIKKVLVFINGKNLYYFPEKGWSEKSDGTVIIPTPEGYEDKNEEYYAEKYPHTIDFCIHSFETSDDETFKKCAKCGETVTLKENNDFESATTPDNESDDKGSSFGTAVVITVISVAVIAIVAAVIFVMKKKKK